MASARYAFYSSGRLDTRSKDPNGPFVMILDDPLDIAQSALVRVANLASQLGAHKKRPICGRLGAELLLAADFLKSAEFDQQEQLRSRSLKLLRDVELICRVSSRDSESICSSKNQFEG